MPRLFLSYGGNASRALELIGMSPRRSPVISHGWSRQWPGHRPESRDSLRLVRIGALGVRSRHGRCNAFHRRSFWYRRLLGTSRCASQGL